MRWSSLLVAGLFAVGIVLFDQLPAHSAGATKPDPSWQAVVAMDDGEPEEILPQSFEALRAKLTPSDPLAVLQAIGFALAEVGDGATYVWHRTDGPLMGNVRMVASFRRDDGSLCRKFALTLILGEVARPVAITACRDAGGQWVLGG